MPETFERWRPASAAGRAAAGALFARSRALTLGFSAKYEVSSASSGLGTKAGTKAGSSASCSRSHALWIPSQSTPAKNGCALTSAAPSRVPRRSSTSGRRSADETLRAAPDKPRVVRVGIRAGVGVGGGVGVGARVRGFLQSGSGGHAMSLERMFSKIFTGDAAWKGGAPTSKLEHDHAQRPPVHLRAVRLAEQNLRGEVIGRAFRDAGPHRRGTTPAGSVFRSVGATKDAPAPQARARLHGGVAVVVHRGGARPAERPALAPRGGGAAVAAAAYDEEAPATVCASFARPNAEPTLSRLPKRSREETAAPPRSPASRGPASRAMPTLESPKSVSLTCPAAVTSRLSGFRSRWMIPRAVAVLQREHDLRRVLPAVVLPEAPELPQQRRRGRRRRRTR